MGNMRSKPKDFGQSVVNRLHVAPAERVQLALGQFTANTANVKADARFIADRRMRIEEIWFSADAVPNDADGAMTIAAINYDVSEGGSDTIITAFDAETLTTAEKALQATLTSETVENEHVMEAGDVLRFQLTNDSAAIDTNAKVYAIIVFKTLEDVVR